MGSRAGFSPASGNPFGWTGCGCGARSGTPTTRPARTAHAKCAENCSRRRSPTCEARAVPGRPRRRRSCRDTSPASQREAAGAERQRLGARRIGRLPGAVPPVLARRVQLGPGAGAAERSPQFVARIGGLEIHFYWVRGKGPSPRPLLLTHGWPGSVVEFLPVIDALTDPKSTGGESADSFDVVVPSLPGFRFTRPPPHPLRPHSTAPLR